MSFVLPAKAPGDTVKYAVSFASFAGSASLSSYTLVRAADPNGTATVTSSQSGYVINCVFAGGGVSGIYAYTPTLFDLTATFSDGRVLVNTMMLPILPPTLLHQPRTSTKRQIVDMAYEECALAGYEFDVTPEELQSALRRLDTLMAEWQGSGLRMGYNFPASIGTGNLDDWSGVPDACMDTAAKYLALRIAPRMNKALGSEARQARAAGMVALRTYCMTPVERQLSVNTPYGAGNKYWALQWPVAMPPVVQVEFTA